MNSKLAAFDQNGSCFVDLRRAGRPRSSGTTSLAVTTVSTMPMKKNTSR
jgi:hypothetical protein